MSALAFFESIAEVAARILFDRRRFYCVADDGDALLHVATEES